MDLTGLKKHLRIEDVDFRIQSINAGGYATILAYKDARVDMNRLDEVCSPLNWKREHTRDNHNCIVSIWDDEKLIWISKEDTGSESFSDAEKGLASDSFKRACFNWGIGRELYDYPIIQIKLKDDEFTEKNGKRLATYKLRLKEWVWGAKWDEDKLIHLAAKDTSGNVRFNWKDNG